MQRATEASLEHIQREFTSAHPPKHSLRFADFTDDEPDGTCFRCVIRNIGETSATIVRENLTIALWAHGTPFPNLPPYEEAVSKDGRWPLHPGETRGLSARDVGATSQFALARQVPNMRGLVVGYLDYEDGARIRRRFAFARLYDFSKQALIDIVQPDYNYEE